MSSASAPRSGAVLLLTQADEAAADWLELARQYPEVEIRRVPLTRLQVVDSLELDSALQDLGAGEFGRVFLPSPSAVGLLAQELQRRGIEWPASTRAALPGPGSVESFRARFLRDSPPGGVGGHPAIDAPPGPPHDAAHLIRSLPEPPSSARSRRVLALARIDGRRDWVARFEARGFDVRVVTLYEACVCGSPPEGLGEWLEQLRRDRVVPHWVIGAASQFDTLCRWRDRGLLGGAGPELADHEFHVPHPAVSAHARGLGLAKLDEYVSRSDVFRRLQSAES